MGKVRKIRERPKRSRVVKVGDVVDLVGEMERADEQPKVPRLRVVEPAKKRDS